MYTIQPCLQTASQPNLYKSLQTLTFPDGTPCPGHIPFEYGCLSCWNSTSCREETTSHALPTLPTSFLTDTKRITPDGFRLFSFVSTALQVNKSLQTANFSKQSSTPRADKVYSEEKHNEEGLMVAPLFAVLMVLPVSSGSRRDSHRPMAGAT